MIDSASPSPLLAGDDSSGNNRREALHLMAGLLGMAGGMGLAATAQAESAAALAAPRPPVPLDFPGHGTMPWLKRAFHLYTGDDGLSRIETLPVTAPGMAQVAMFLRRGAERVSLGGTAPDGGFDFHVANQPTLLIPIFGTMRIGLADGTFHDLVYGDIAFAEDCTGKGHISRAGPDGSFMVSVQLPKALCPARGSSDRAKIWTGG
ncbi:MAG TPA: hypothetical protein VN222_17960 [Novosphingobium sp.]|nr:hypothetical protein [Novosphingobium sp.]